MFHHRLQELRRAELIQEAADHRLARRVVRARRAAGRAAKDGEEGPVSTSSERYARAA